MIFGYGRVSTAKQDLEGQHQALTGAGCGKLYLEKISGKAAGNRPELAKVLKRLEAGDVLVVTKIDRLARNTRDLLNIVEAIETAGAKFRSLGDPWADTTSPTGKLLLTVLAGLAEFERHLILSRTEEGRSRAKAKGTHMGRPRSLSPGERKVALERRVAGESCEAIARDYQVSHSTISRL